MFGKKCVTERWFNLKCKIIGDDIEHAMDLLRREFEYKIAERITPLERKINCLQGNHEWITRRALIKARGGLNQIVAPLEGNHILYCKHCNAPDKTVVRVTEKAGDE